MSLKRLKIRCSDEEWETLTKAVKNKFNKTPNSYLRSELPRLSQKIDLIENIPKKQRWLSVPEDSYHILQEISEKMNKPVAFILNEYIFHPLLRP